MHQPTPAPQSRVSSGSRPPGEPPCLGTLWWREAQLGVPGGKLRRRRPRLPGQPLGPPQPCWPGCSNRSACAAPRSGSLDGPPTCGGGEVRISTRSRQGLREWHSLGVRAHGELGSYMHRAGCQLQGMGILGPGFSGCRCATCSQIQGWSSMSGVDSGSWGYN